MSDAYRLVFAGEILDGQHPAVVRKRLSEALKLSDSAADKLFSGQSVVVKRSVDRAAAAKLQQQFKQCGARLRVKAIPQENAADTSDVAPASSQTQTPAPATGKAEVAPAAAQPEPTQAGSSQFDLAAVGADLSDAAGQTRPQADIDTSHLSVVAPSEVSSQVESAPTQETSSPDVSHIDVAPVGERLLPADHARDVQAELDITMLDVEVLELGAMLSDGTRVSVEPLSIDADFDLADVGEVLSTAAPKPEPTAPDTSHIQLQ
ncbi:MAG: hypothetical protein NXH85_11610 [Pseudomonadaceae bacterium]|nr:hypothetical protein [Pseudomonadaceae bacterium]